MLTKYEFNCLSGPDGNVEIRHDQDPIFILTPMHREFIAAYIQLLSARKPYALELLRKRFEKSKENRMFYDFLIVRRHIRCNFAVIDDKWDIDQNGNFRTEYVFCPHCSECKEYAWVCQNSESILLKSEVKVLRLIKAGHTNKEISELLFISEHTVHNHRNNILKRTGSNNTADLVRFWYENNME